MDLNNLAKALEGEPKFRLQQAEQAIFKNLISDWPEAISLPLALREKLNADCPLSIKADVLKAANGQSFKAAVTLADGLKVETVLIKHMDGRNTVCVSSQVGCAGGCLFCLTGQLGFKRNLTADEIVRQVLLWARHLKPEKEKVSNVVFMGMGEPLLNYDNVLAAVKFLNAKSGLAIGIRHISLSTVGIPEGIKRLAQEKIKPNLSLSLHAVDKDLRARLIPLSRSYPLGELKESLDFYIKKTSQRVMFEYLMLKGHNDSVEQAQELASFVKSFKKPMSFPEGRTFYFVNLIAYNLSPLEKRVGFEPSAIETIKRFKEILQTEGVEVVQRYKFGQDIKGACGQLAVDN